MPDYRDLDPTKLKPGLVDGGKLKPSLTTDLYTGGIATTLTVSQVWRNRCRGCLTRWFSTRAAPVVLAKLR